MKKLLVAMAATVVGVSSLVTLAIAADWNPVLATPALKPVNTIVAAINSGNAQSVATLYSSNAVIVDNVGPALWRGADAGELWISNVTGRFGKFSEARFTAASSPAEVDVSDTKAYIVVQGVVTSTVPGHPFHNRGAFTFTLRKVSGDWKITSQTWTPVF